MVRMNSPVPTVANATTLAISHAPIAQLVERTAYTRRELRTGARLEVRVLLGVPACMCADDCPVAQRIRAPRFERGGRAFKSRRDIQSCINTEGGARRRATGPENRADLTVEGSTPSPSANHETTTFRVGWALASPRRCKRPAYAVVVQFHPYPPIRMTMLLSPRADVAQRQSR
jgi:hypothetical protein